MAQAQNYRTAVRTVIDERYAEGELVEYPGSTAFNNYLVNGVGAVYINMKVWALHTLANLLYKGESKVTSSGWESYYRDVYDLIGEPFVSHKDASGCLFLVIGPSNSTLFEADGFAVFISQQNNGVSSNTPGIVVTYKIDHLNLADGVFYGTYLDVLHEGTYNPDAGYEVYY
ncbi:MAG: hypothetical protein LBU07_03790 [Coriobacteriales bacterium]|jgi:hypothetical protein|nr:hypothetical protein [Coriobacteriales bacterium]